MFRLLLICLFLGGCNGEMFPSYTGAYKLESVEGEFPLTAYFPEFKLPNEIVVIQAPFNRRNGQNQHKIALLSTQNTWTDQGVVNDSNLEGLLGITQVMSGSNFAGSEGVIGSNRYHSFHRSLSNDFFTLIRERKVSDWDSPVIGRRLSSGQWIEGPVCRYLTGAKIFIGSNYSPKDLDRVYPITYSDGTRGNVGAEQRGDFPDLNMEYWKTPDLQIAVVFYKFKDVTWPLISECQNPGESRVVRFNYKRTLNLDRKVEDVAEAYNFEAKVFVDSFDLRRTNSEVETIFERLEQVDNIFSDYFSQIVRDSSELCFLDFNLTCSRDDI